MATLIQMPPGRSRFSSALALLALLGASGLGAPLQAPFAEEGAKAALPSPAEIDKVLHELASITGFKIHRQLPFALISRDEVNKYVKEQIRESVKPDDVRAQELTLKKFGFAPPDFDLKQTTIDLLTEQAAAFYDYHRRKLFISDWATVNMRDEAIVHELGHALADQNFRIEKFVDKGADDSDVSMARDAVVEGQASWLSLEVGARRAGRTLADPDTARALLHPMPDQDPSAADAEYPVFSKAPLYIRRTLMFPYEDGEDFQQAVFLHDGQAGFSRVFRDPPVSTAQILHPDLYFTAVKPAHPELPKPAPHWKPFVRGTLGELETRILLEQFAGKDVADSLGPRLRGGEYRIDEGGSKTARRYTLTYLSEWADETAAERFFVAYRKALTEKWKHMTGEGVAGQKFSGSSEDGYFRLTRTGVQVLSEEGFPDPI